MPFRCQNGSEVAVIGTWVAKGNEMGDQNAGLFFVSFLEVCEQIRKHPQASPSIPKHPHAATRRVAGPL